MSTKELLQENRSRGWASVGDDVPSWVRSHIIAFRAAALDGREFRMSARQIQEAETRSALATKAVSFVRHLFRSSNGVSFETQLANSLWYDEGLMKMRAYRIGLELANELRHLTALQTEERSRKARCATLVEQIHDAAGDL